MKNIIKNFRIEKTGLLRWILLILKKKKIFFATSLQQACIPAILRGSDLLLFSRTGTGKTLSYILPSIQIIDSSVYINQVIILVPTQELGLQVYDMYSTLSKNRSFKTYFISNEIKNMKSFNSQKNQIKRKCLVSTPRFFSNFCEFVGLGFIQEKNLLIMDEADLLLGVKFFNLLEGIIALITPVQLLIITASFNKNIFLLKFPVYQKKYFSFYENMNRFSLLSKSKHEYIFSPKKLKLLYLEIVLKKKYLKSLKNEWEPPKGTIIFVPNAAMAENVGKILEKNNISSLKLNHQMSKNSRLITIQLLRSFRNKILISDDLGSIGLDLPMVDFILNLNFPSKISTYINRAGRTSRFFKKGTCLSLVSPDELDYLHFIEKKTTIIFKNSPFFKENEIIKNIIK